MYYWVIVFIGNGMVGYMKITKLIFYTKYYVFFFYAAYLFYVTSFCSGKIYFRNQRNYIVIMFDVVKNT